MTFRHRAGVTPYMSACAFAGSCVFVKQSPGPILCGPLRLPARGRTPYTGHPFSRSYGVNLPSSLTRTHPSTLVLSHPATRVGLRYGRSRHPAGGFSRRSGSIDSPEPGSSRSPTPRSQHPKALSPAGLDAPCPIGALDLPDPAPPADFVSRERSRNINRVSIAYALRPRLRPD